MVRKPYKETKAEVFWSSEKKRGLRKNHLGGKDRGEKGKRKTKKTVGKGHSGRLRQVNNRSWTMGT